MGQQGCFWLATKQKCSRWCFDLAGRKSLLRSGGLEGGIWTSDNVGELGDVGKKMEDESGLVEEEAEGVDEGATTEKCRNA